MVIEKALEICISYGVHHCELVVPRVRLQLSHESIRVFHCNKEVINVGADILIAMSSITIPNIRISVGGLETKVAHGVSQLFMESGTRTVGCTEPCG